MYVLCFTYYKDDDGTKADDSKFVRQNQILKMAELKEGKQIIEGMGNEK